MGDPFTRLEVMAVTASRYFRQGTVAFIGTGLPMVAAYLAKATHAPDVVLVFESGMIDPRPVDLAPAVGDFRLCYQAAMHADLFYALRLLQRGVVDLGILGAAEVDACGNINSTVIGDYRHPTVRLPGSGGANDIASMAKRTLIMLPHERRKFPERLSYLTSPGHVSGREALGLPGDGPTAVITDLAVFQFDDSGHARLARVHPGVSLEEVQARTGFSFAVDTTVQTSAAPTAEEIRLLREFIDPDGMYIGEA